MSPSPLPLWHRFGLQGYTRMKAAQTAMVLRNAKPVLQQQLRHSGGGHESMNIVPGRWNWEIFKDYIHAYTMVWMGPVLAVVAYANLYVGPAKLQPIPDGYVPKQHEYYRHPITRFLMKYIYLTEQEDYERHLHYLWEQEKQKRQRMLIKEVKRLMSTDGDYKGYYHTPITGRFTRVHRKYIEKDLEEKGTNAD